MIDQVKQVSIHQHHYGFKECLKELLVLEVVLGEHDQVDDTANYEYLRYHFSSYVEEGDVPAEAD